MATHWIDWVQIDGFRNLRDLELKGLGGLTVLVGANNSGKTSILEALSILCSYADPSEWLTMVGRRDFGRLDETRPQSIRWCFNRGRSMVYPDQPFVGRCRMSCKGKLDASYLRVICQDIFANPPFRSGTPDESPVLEPEIDIPEMRRGLTIIHELEFARPVTLFDEDRRSVDFTVWEDDVATLVNRRGRRPRQVETEMLSPYSYQLNRFQTRQFSEGRHRNSIDTMIALLRGFDPEIESVEIQSLRGGRPSLYVHHRRLGFAPLSVFGDAMRRAFLLATTVMTFEGGGVLFIDEIETGIHVHALQRVFSWLARVANERNVQVIATTHSLEAVDAILFGAPDGMRDDIVAFHLEQTEERTIAKRFDGDLLARLRKERGLDVR